MNLFEETPIFDIFNVPEGLPEISIPDVPIPPKRKINLNDINNPARETYLKKMREKIEKNKENLSS